jgi:hypothetical protein
MSLFNLDNLLGNSTRLPLFKRGTKGDFYAPATLKSPLPPLLQKGGGTRTYSALSFPRKREPSLSK